MELSEFEVKARIARGEASEEHRIGIHTIPLAERYHNFHEVDLTLTEEEALIEAERCVRCGTCAECLECVAACERGAIDHDMQETHEEFTVGTIILATGFQRFRPGPHP